MRTNKMYDELSTASCAILGKGEISYIILTRLQVSLACRTT